MIIPNKNKLFGIYTQSEDQSINVIDQKVENGNSINIEPIEKSVVQKWQIHKTDNRDEFYIMAEHSGKVLDNKKSNKVGTTLHQWELVEEPQQRWKIEDAGDNSYYIKSVYSGLYLTKNYWGNLTQENLGIKYPQKWIIVDDLSHCLDIVSVVEETIKFLKSQEKYKPFFNAIIKLLNKRLSIWKSNKITIGLIGVTSTGKSTLINALFGEKLLPATVSPTTNVNVICEKGDVLKATIIKKDDKKIVIKENIFESLEKHADENQNQGNMQLVEEIHLQSPKFELTDKIQLWDTPGLDGYGHEAHERITLQFALPYIDLVLFLTTVKPNSDEQNLTRIDQVSEDDKPLIIVQNMIDSIGPKEKKEGLVKNKDEVLKEHFERVRKILNNSKLKSSKNASIIQVSGLKGLNGDWNESGIDKLIKKIETDYALIKKRCEGARAKQISKTFNEMLKTIKATNTKDDYFIEKEETNNEIENDISTFTKDTKKEIECLKNRQKDFENNFDNIQNQIRNLGRENFRGAQNIVHTYSKKMREVNSELSDLIAEANAKLSKIVEKLNLTKEDLKYSLSPFSGNQSIKIPTKEKTETYTTKEKTFVVGGDLTRWISRGNWGYKRVKRKRIINVVKKNELITSLNADLNNWKRWMKDTLKLFSNINNSHIEMLSKELQSRKESLEIQRKTTILESEKKKITATLTNFKNKITKLSPSIINENPNKSEFEPPVREPSIETEISSLTKAIYDLSHRESYQPLYAIRDYCETKMDDIEHVFMWAWDNNAIEKAVDLFYSDIPELTQFNDGNINSELLFGDGRKFTTIIENRINKDNEILKESNDDKCVYIIIDLQQIGFTKTQLDESKIANLKFKKTTWVIQNISGLLNSDTLIEGFIEFQKMIKVFSLPIDSLIALHKDPFYSVLLYELYFNGDELLKNDTQNELLDWQKKFCNKIQSGEIKNLPNYLEEFKQLKRS